MSRLCVFQVLGAIRGYEKVIYELKDRREEARLSGKALCNFLASPDECKLYILAPESLVTTVASTSKEAHDLLSNWEELSMTIGNHVKELASGIPMEVRILPSIGLYSGNNWRVRFDGSGQGEVELAILIHMLEATGYGGNCCSRVVFDISTGLNIYASMAVKALRSLVTADKLGRLDDILFGDISGIEAAIAYATPVQRGYRGPYTLNIEELDARIFFTYPLTVSDIHNVKPDNIIRGLNKEEKKKVGKCYSELFSKIRDFLRLGLKLHNTIKYNVPLALYQIRSEGLVERCAHYPLNLVEKLARFIEDSWKLGIVPKARSVDFNGSELKVKYSGVERRLTLYTVQALFETAALMRLRERLLAGASMDIGISIDKIRSDFTSIYENNSYLSQDLMLNKRLLERDLREVERAAAKLNEGECKTLKELLESNSNHEGSSKQGGSRGSNEEMKRVSDPKRNFFAHSGLSKELVETCRENANTLIRYRKEKLREVEDWLEKPV